MKDETLRRKELLSAVHEEADRRERADLRIKTAEVMALCLKMEDLRRFVVLAEKKTLRQAALELGVTQPHLTAWLPRLEKACGAKLADLHRGRPKSPSFYRTTKSVDGEDRFHRRLEEGPGRGHFELTPAGHELLAHASWILRDIGQAEAAIRAVNDGNFLCVGHTPVHREPVLAAAAALMENDRHLRVRIEQQSDDIVEERVRDGGLHLGLLFRCNLSRPGLVYEPLASQPLRVVFSASHKRLEKRNAVTLEDLARERFVLLKQPRDERSLVDEYFDRSEPRFTPDIAAETNVLGTALAMVRTTSLVTVLPVRADRHDLRGLRLASLPNAPPPQDCFLIWRDFKKLLPGPAMRSFAEALREQVGAANQQRRPSGG